MIETTSRTRFWIRAAATVLALAPVAEEQALERARAAGLVNPELTEKMRALVRTRKAQ